jgi:NAD-dependent deacetylase
MKEILEEINEHIRELCRQGKFITFLTGAGISAESGIPTYRGHDGIWIKGTKYHQPKEIATFRFFRQNPFGFWEYTLQRMALFGGKQPNAGHFALVEMEQKLGENFRLITQNIDELHRRAGIQEAHLAEIHGKASTMRCSAECSEDIYPIPTIENVEQEEKKIICPRCGHYTRPNILLFDESYNERLYKLDTSLAIAQNTGMLITIGTTGETYLPTLISEVAIQQNAVLVDINIEDNYFGDLAQDAKRGYVLRGKSSEILSLWNELLV